MIDPISIEEQLRKLNSSQLEEIIRKSQVDKVHLRRETAYQTIADLVDMMNDEENSRRLQNIIDDVRGTLQQQDGMQGQETIQKDNIESLIGNRVQSHPNIDKYCLTDWSEEVPDVSNFLGRTDELSILEQWLLKDRCRLVAIVGIKGIGKTHLSIKLGEGGIGKTDLSVKLAKNVQDKFDYIIWRRLVNAPDISKLLTDLIKVISNQEDTEFLRDLDSKINRLIQYLKQYRCLIILDNVEAILSHKNQPEGYLEGCEGYGTLFQKIGEINHESCILITSREIPKEIVQLEGNHKPVRLLKLTGLNIEDGKNFLLNHEISGSDIETKEIIDFYNGNPLALDLTAKLIKNDYLSDISSFLREGKKVFSDIRDLLNWHFDRLSDVEKEIMYWFAINREPASINQIKEDILSPILKNRVQEGFNTLNRKLPIEKSNKGFSLQPVLIEYMTDKFTESICQDIYSGEINVFFNNYALIKATSKNYVRESQVRKIILPILEELKHTYGNHDKLESTLIKLLAKSRKDCLLRSGYLAGNIINLFANIKTNLKDYDFSNLAIWQAYLQVTSLHNTSFYNSEVKNSIFIDSFASLPSVTFSSDGNLICAGDADGAIHVWQTINPKLFLSFQGHKNWVNSVAFSPDNRLIISGGEDRIVKIWNATDGKEFKSFKGHNNRIWSVTFSPNGQFIATGGDDRNVKVWNIEDNRKVYRNLKGHKSRICSVAFSPNGQFIASGSEDQTVKVWNIKNGKCILTLDKHTSFVRSVAFSLDNQKIASSSEDLTIRLWDINTGECIKTLKDENIVLSVSFINSDSSLLISGGEDRKVKIWDVNTAKCIKILEGHTNRVRSVIFNSNNKLLASSGNDGTARLWDVETGECLHTLEGYTDKIWSVAFSSDGKTIASSGNDKIVRIWHIDTGQCIKMLEKHTNWVYSLAFSPDGRFLASGSDDKTIIVWDIKDGKFNFSNEFKKHLKWIRSVTFSNDGKLLASGSEDKTIILWDIKKKELIHTFKGHSDRVRTIAFSNDGKLLASGGEDKTIILWDVINKRKLNVYRVHKNRVRSVVFSHDGKFLASGSDDGTIIIWNISGDSISQFKTLPGGISNGIHSVKFSYDDRFLASGCDDNTIRIWNTSTWKNSINLERHNNRIRAIDFNINDYTLASASEDGTIIIWNAETGEHIRTIRSPRPYEGLNITALKGLTDAQKTSLIALGAVDDSA